jgi:hemoglobin
MGLAISAAEWEANMKYTAAALDKHDIADAEKAEFLAIFKRDRNDIVESH